MENALIMVSFYTHWPDTEEALDLSRKEPGGHDKQLLPSEQVLQVELHDEHF